MPILPFQGFGLVRYPTHEPSQIVSRFPHDLGVPSRSHWHLMYPVQLLILAVLALLLGILLLSLAVWLLGGTPDLLSVGRWFDPSRAHHLAASAGRLADIRRGRVDTIPSSCDSAPPFSRPRITTAKS